MSLFCQEEKSAHKPQNFMEILQCSPMRAKCIDKIIWLFSTFYNLKSLLAHLSEIKDCIEDADRTITLFVWKITMCKEDCKTDTLV